MINDNEHAVGKSVYISWKLLPSRSELCTSCAKTSDLIFIPGSVPYQFGHCTDCIFAYRLVSVHQIRDFDALPVNRQLDVRNRIEEQHSKFAIQLGRMLPELVSESKSNELQIAVHDAFNNHSSCWIPSAIQNLCVQFLFDERHVVSIGKTFHCMDTQFAWTHVIVVQANETMVYVRYRDWSEIWNEWINFQPNNRRLEPCNCNCIDSQPTVLLAGDKRHI